jgi:hypothetical protein
MELTQDDVSKRLISYDSPNITDSLYSMGIMLLNECAERVRTLDSKATTIISYTGAIIGLMMSTFPIWTSAVDRWAIFAALVGALFGLLGAASGFWATYLTEFSMPSDSDWIEKDGLQDQDRLKRYYIASIHLAIQSHEMALHSKTRRVKIAQTCLFLMVVSISIALGNATLKATARPSRLSSDRALSILSE